MRSRVAYSVLLTLASLLIVSCGGGSGSNPDPSAALISGNWQMSLQKTGGTQPPRTQSGFLLQNSQNGLSGAMLLTDSPCSGLGNVSGSVNGSNINFTVSPTGISVQLTGTVASGNTAMSGDYAILSTGCTGSKSPSESGTWTASLVKPLSGTIQGTFISKFGPTYTLSGQVSQGQNSGTSNAPLSGSLVATGYACFTDANFTGLISGTAVLINFTDANSGIDLGQISGTVTTDGTSLTGTYATVPQGSPAVSPCRFGDSGTISLSL